MTRNRQRRHWAVAVAVGALCALPVAGYAAVADGGPEGTDRIEESGGSTVTASAPVVTTENGKVRGGSNGASRVFEGIPYATPPVDDLRWKAPRPAESWTGVRAATEPGPACAQLPGELPDGSESEDCLYLNVTVPDRPGAADQPRPVLVWLHGGGFFMGAGSNYDAKRMAERGDVVVVTINYRLGIFGNFAYPGLRDSGTFGLLDQQLAMRWVHHNIEAFGGDPDNVTMAGQSAGSMSSCAQLTSPGAVGLFDRAVTQSGSCRAEVPKNASYRDQEAYSFFEPVAKLREQGRQVGADLGCSVGSDGGDPLDCLRKLPVRKLMPQHQAFIKQAYGTRALPIAPAAAVANGLFHRVPVLSGTTKNENMAYTSRYDDGEPITERTLDEVMRESFGADEAAVRREYPRGSYDNAAEMWSAITTDAQWSCQQYDTSADLAEHVSVYQYEFADPNPPALSPIPPKIDVGAQHASDLWSFFDIGGYAPDFTPEQRQLSDRMIDYWTNFATDGDPNGHGLQDWPRFDLAENAGETAYTQSLAPGRDGIGPVDLAAEHHCGFWSEQR